MSNLLFIKNLFYLKHKLVKERHLTEKISLVMAKGFSKSSFSMLTPTSSPWRTSLLSGFLDHFSSPNLFESKLLYRSKSFLKLLFFKIFQFHIIGLKNILSHRPFWEFFNLVPLSLAANQGENLRKYSTVIGCRRKCDKIDVEGD